MPRLAGPAIVRLHRLLSIGSRIVRRVYSAWYAAQLRQCGSGFRLGRRSVILSPERITIGDGFVSMGQLYLYATDGDIVIGDNVSVNTNVQLGASGARIVIGNNVLIAPNVVIRSANHGISAGSLIRHQRSLGGDINIGDDVWIGSNAVITSNVTIATGTVVGAGAVVTKSTEPYSVVGGVPARQIFARQ